MTDPADAGVNTALPVYITGENVTYDNETTEILGSGDIIFRHEGTSIFADSIYINIDKGDVAAEGNVFATDGKARIYTDKIYYNIKTKDAYTKHADIIYLPWIARGKKLKKTGNKIELESPVFTTCDNKQPHYRMEASMIYFYEDEKVEAWHTRFFLGNIPVLYWPYYTQPIEGNEDPFDIKFGWNDNLGFYVYVKYYWFFNKLNRLSLGYDYMEKRGNKVKLDMEYGIKELSTGYFKGFYNHDKEKATGKDRWQVDYYHSQLFNKKGTVRAGVKVKSFSDMNLFKDSLITEDEGDIEEGEDVIDLLKHEYNASFTASFLSNNSLVLKAADIEKLNTATSKYEKEKLVLPSVSYSMSSMKVPFVPNLYYGHSLNFERKYMGSTLMAAEEKGDYYRETGGFSPRLSVSPPSFYMASFSANAGLTADFKNNEQNSETGEAWAELSTNYNLSENLKLSLLPGGHLNFKISHSFSRNLGTGVYGREEEEAEEPLLHAGVTANSAALSLNGGYGAFNFDALASYNLLPEFHELKEPTDVSRFSILKINADYN